MAKDGSKTGGRKKRIPKEIAGVKLPKELRRAGEKALDHLGSPQGQAMIAGGLSMAAAAIAAAAEKNRAKAADQRPPANDAAQASDPSRRPGTGGIDGEKVTQAVDQLLNGLFGRRSA